MDEHVKKQWENLLTPEILRSNLIIASLYITAYEILRNSIIDRIRDFFISNIDEKGFTIGSHYQIQVLSKNKSLLFASLLWLRDNHAINDEDLSKFRNIKNIRNKIAHEINLLIVEGFPEDFQTWFQEMIYLLNKIERWWIIEFDIPVSLGMSKNEIDEEEIIPGPIALLKIMLDISLGTDEDAEYYIKKFFNQNPETNIK
jgi:hypothetical protein